jgi:DNA polymerase I-like protein with 3'-5' exonuclease and polymerase domains
MGADTLDLLTASSLKSYTPKSGKFAGKEQLDTIGSKEGIIKWRGSIFEMTLPSGRKQKCVAAMHPASFIRGQWKWLPLYKYIDVPRAVIQSSFSEMKLTPRSAIVGPSFRQAVEYLGHLNQQEWVSIDYEGRQHLTCLGAGSTAGEAMCIPLSRVGSSAYWTSDEEILIWKLWARLLENPKVKKIAQNAPFEWIKSWMYGIYPTPLGIDTMTAHHCLYPDWGGTVDDWNKRKRDIDNPGHGLALITSQYTDQPYYKDDGRRWEPSMGEDRFWQYNALDVMVTFESAMKMKKEIEDAGLAETYNRAYLGSIFDKTIQMEWDGILIDTVLRDEERVKSEAELVRLCEELGSKLGYRVIPKTDKKGRKADSSVLNLASPAQLKDFFKKKGYKIGFDRQTGREKLDKDDLAALAIKHNDESIHLILKIRKLQDFINDTLNMRLDQNGKIHCHWKLGGTNTGRWSSTESILESGRNLQNLDRQGVARQLFLPT